MNLGQKIIQKNTHTTQILVHYTVYLEPNGVEDPLLRNNKMQSIDQSNHPFAELLGP